MNGSPIAAVIRGWVDLYTRGLPADARSARRDEIDDDLWCEHAEAAAAGRSARSLDADLALRLLFGIPSDISWRLAYRRAPTPASLDRSGIGFARVISIVSMIGGAAWATWTIVSVVGGDAAWAGSLGYVLFWSMLIAAIGLSLVTFAVVFANVDRLRDGAVLVGMLGGAAGLVTILGPYVIGVIGLPLGSAVLMLDVARLGAIDIRVARLHAAAGGVSAVLVAGLLARLVDLGHTVAVIALGLAFATYALTWIAIGWSLRDGKWMPEVPAPGA
jgi:hypothetical protein